MVATLTRPFGSCPSHRGRPDRPGPKQAGSRHLADANYSPSSARSFGTRTVRASQSRSSATKSPWCATRFRILLRPGVASARPQGRENSTVFGRIPRTVLRVEPNLLSQHRQIRLPYRPMKRSPNPLLNRGSAVSSATSPNWASTSAIDEGSSKGSRPPGLRTPTIVSSRTSSDTP